MPDLEAVLSTDLGELIVEGSYPTADLLRRDQNAAIGECESSASSERRQRNRSLIIKLHRGYAKSPECIRRVIDAIGARRSHQYLGEGQRTDRKRIVGDVEQQSASLSVMRIRTAQMSNQDTGVEHYHAGQSSRSSVR